MIPVKFAPMLFRPFAFRADVPSGLGHFDVPHRGMTPNSPNCGSARG
jgi:hypothetical protein